MNDNRLGVYIKSLRLKKKYDQEFMASKLNIVRQTYSHYETGRITPPIDSLVKIADILDTPLEYLVRLSSHDSDFASSNSFAEDACVYSSPAQIFQDSKELELIQYYRLLDARDKNDLIDIARMKSKRKK